MNEAHAAKQRRQGCGFLVAGGEFDEGKSVDIDPRRNVGHLDPDAGFAAADIVHERDERPIPVAGQPIGAATPELVVEDLQADGPVIAGGRNGAHEIGDGEVSFPRHGAEMARPVQQIHVDQRGVGQLHEEDPVARDAADGVGVDLARQCVKTVQDQPDIRVIGAPDDFPGVAMVVDMATPGERLVSDAHPLRGGDLAKFGEVVGGAVYPAKRRRVKRGTDQHQVGAKLGHGVELPARALKGLGAQIARKPLEVPERLEKRDLQPVIADHVADLARGAGIGNEILFEDLDPVEAGPGDGGQLFAEIAGNRDRGDRGFHAASSCVRRSARSRAGSNGRPANSAQASRP